MVRLTFGTTILVSFIIGAGAKTETEDTTSSSYVVFSAQSHTRQLSVYGILHGMHISRGVLTRSTNLRSRMSSRLSGSRSQDSSHL